jgi:single-strand DNA-binding protein
MVTGNLSARYNAAMAECGGRCPIEAGLIGRLADHKCRHGRLPFAVPHDVAAGPRKVPPSSRCLAGTRVHVRAGGRHDTPTATTEVPMRDIATAALSGNLTSEVELHELPSGSEVARLRVASTARRRSGEEWVDKTNYFTVEVYGAQARPCAEHLGKGARLVVDAELDWRAWTDQENNRKEAVTLRARQVLFESARRGNGRGEGVDPAPPDTEPVAATATGDGSARADDLPF